MEVEQPNSGNSCLIGRKRCKLIKETQEGKNVATKKNLQKRLKNQNLEEKVYFMDMGKDKAQGNYIPHISGALNRSALTR